MPSIIKEACVENFEQALQAQRLGADRVELCGSLNQDGLTPDLTELELCLNELQIGTKVMIRHRPGDFCYDEDDQRRIFEDLEKCQRLGATKFVFGALTESKKLDIPLLRRFAGQLEAHEDSGLTIHKAIDDSIQPLEDLEALKQIANVDSVLSSGQQPTALQGAAMLHRMQAVCSDHFNLIAAGKITRGNLDEVHRTLNLREYHGRRIVQPDTHSD